MVLVTMLLLAAAVIAFVEQVERRMRDGLRVTILIAVLFAILMLASVAMFEYVVSTRTSRTAIPPDAYRALS